MKTTNLFMMFVAAAALSFTACSNDTNENETKDSKVEVKFGSTITGTVQTKAKDASWTGGDRIGIFMVKTGQPLSAANISETADNRMYVTASGGESFSSFGANIIYFPSDASLVDFFAYYPYTATGAAAGQINNYIYPVNVATQTNQAAIDLLYSNNAIGANKTSSSVTLQFSHMLSKLVFNVVPGNGITAAELNYLSIKIKGMNTTANFDLATGLLNTPAGPADITARTITPGTAYEAIVLPTTTVANGVSVLFALNNTANDIYTWVVPGGTNFNAGEKNTYTITISRTGLQVIGTITNWTTGSGGNGVAL